ncbi:hypothetical protein AX17_005675 [Amanita inopinata Kibby_2008]|nr:hypothetical protein AX17_005675 [Amanita inopinata Kibby_2008]
MESSERSLSRGREAFQSSGRGGFGNIRRASESRDGRPDTGPDDFSSSRGREPRMDHPTHIYSTGRGGAGNIRSPSREIAQVARRAELKEQEIIKSHVAADQEVMHSIGRGGIGNIAASRSRSREPLGSASGPTTFYNPLHSTGRGGAGNFVPKDSLLAELTLEDDDETIAQDSSERMYASPLPFSR